MALPVLDGNQSATTLSSVVTGGEHIVAHTVVSLGSTAISNITNAVSGSVVSVSNFPATQTIAGTVTANVPQDTAWAGIYDSGNDCIKIELANLNGDIISPSNPLPISGTVTVGNSVTISSLPAISGTVTAGMLIVENAANSFPNQYPPVQLKADGQNGSLRVRMDYSFASDANSSSVIGRSDAADQSPTAFVKASVVAGSVTIGSLPAISGTVTANNPSGALTTRFGSVVTANTAQITSAVTNTSRKYLLAQNISAGTVTIGIGFSPTTTQGIQLTAGGGLTFDAFCPTGAVYWLGAVTGAAWTILEG